MANKACYRCKKEKDISCFHFNKAKKDGLNHICNDCRREYRSAKWAINNEKIKKNRREKYKKNKLKYIATASVWYNVKVGKLIKKPCIVCGEKMVRGHHEDYTKPLDVMWLCAKHHSQLHTEKEMAYLKYSHIMPKLKNGGGYEKSCKKANKTSF